MPRLSHVRALSLFLPPNPLTAPPWQDNNPCPQVANGWLFAGHRRESAPFSGCVSLAPDRRGRKTPSQRHRKTIGCGHERRKGQKGKEVTKAWYSHPAAANPIIEPQALSCARLFWRRPPTKVRGVIPRAVRPGSRNSTTSPAANAVGSNSIGIACATGGAPTSLIGGQSPPFNIGESSVDKIIPSVGT